MTCAVNIVAPVCNPIQCPKVMCMMFCPSGNAVDENGCPSCQCNPVPDACPCGQSCNTTKDFWAGRSGVCQPDGKTCATNAAAPFCFVNSLAASSCVPKTCSSFCESGTVVDYSGCPTCECQPLCPCGTPCSLGQGMMGSCQNDGATCVPNSDLKSCKVSSTAGAMEKEPSSSTGVIISIVVVALLLASLLECCFVDALNEKSRLSTTMRI